MQIRTVPFVQQLRRASFSSSSSPSAKPAAEKFLQVGTALRLSRRFSGADVKAYSDLTGDANPLHSDPDFASRISGFLAPVVHGLLVASLFPRIIASQFPGAVYVSQRLDFKLPVYVDDEIVAEVLPLRIREYKNRYIAKFSTRCFRAGEEPQVIEGEAMAILPTLKLKS